MEEQGQTIEVGEAGLVEGVVRRGAGWLEKEEAVEEGEGAVEEVVSRSGVQEGSLCQQHQQQEQPEV